jgi:NAD(P)-dependent dehydrogenase (short-subunit alcohol dehydrogenase family)
VTDDKTRVAVVTGAGRGIGVEYAKALAGAGFAVAIADINVDGARETAAAIRDGGGKAEGFEVDVSSKDSTLSLAAEVTAKLGVADVLVNNAAMYHSMRLERQIDADLDYWKQIFAVNVEGVLLCTQAFAPAMVEQKWGRVVNQASMGAYVGGGGAYAVSKLAVVGMTQGFARELGPDGVTVNAIAPGLIATEATNTTVPEANQKALIGRTPIGRLGDPLDLTAGLLFLVSEEAGWYTGQTMIIDGGLTSRI